MDMRLLYANENGRLERRPFIHRACVTSGAGTQMEFRHTEGEIEPHRGGDRDRLQGERAVGAADENVGAKPRGDRYLAGRAEIVASEKAGARGRDAVGEHRPYHHAAARGPDIQSELGDRPAVDLLRAGRLGRERADDRLLRADDESDAGRDVAATVPSRAP